MAALVNSSALDSLKPDQLVRALATYPPSVRTAAQPIFQRLALNLDQMQARIRDLAPVLQGGDPKRGREVFFARKANCSVCHAVGSLGGQIGPDLTKIAEIRGGMDLLEAITFPSALVSPAATNRWWWKRNRGGYFKASCRRQTADSLVLIGPDLTEQRIARSEIEGITPSKASVMPDGLVNQVSRAELQDLIAFLLSLK